MANKRMFNLSVVDTDRFLDMPLSSQCLYFHLNMRADDDGFIAGARKIARTIGASEDDLKLLIAKSYVLEFEDGVIVVKHWRLHNTIAKDRYHQTMYLNEKSMLGIAENKEYTLDPDKVKQPCIQNDNNLYTECIQNDNADKIRLDKNRLDKNRLDKDRQEKKSSQKAVYFPEDEILNNTFKDFVDMRKKIKRPMTDRAIELAISKLEKLAGNDNDTMIEILNQSIVNGWVGLFPLKEERQNTKVVDWDKI